MTNLDDLRPGDIFVTSTYGNVFDRVIGSGIRYFTATKDEYGRFENAKVNHTGLYVGGGQIIEAAPGGARHRDWDEYLNNAVWSVNGIAQVQSDGTHGAPILLSEDDRLRIAEEAEKLVGTPYGFLDIAAIACAQERTHRIVDPWKPLEQQPWWVQRIADRHTLICSQLVDQSYRSAGFALFADNRVPGLVSPADIAGLYL